MPRKQAARKEPKLVYVEWDDALSNLNAGWNDEKHIASQKPLRVKSVGWLMADEAEHITLVASRSEDGGVSGDVTIPRGMIKKVVDIATPS